MIRLLFKAALFGILFAYLVKILFPGRRSAPPTPPPPSGEPGTRHRIRTDGLAVRDAEFSELEQK